MTIKENIRRLRIERGLTLEELGKAVGVSKQTIQRYETGQIATIPYDNILLLASTLGVAPQELMGWSNPGQLASFQPAPDESALLKDYHQLNDLGKARARDAVSDLTQITKYRNAEAVQISRQENKDNSIIPISPLSDHLAVNAAHALDPTPEERRHADNIMMDDEEWN